MSRPEDDPRLLPYKVVGLEMPPGLPLPCGQKECVPFSGPCLEKGSLEEGSLEEGSLEDGSPGEGGNPYQARTSCARYIAGKALEGRVEQLELQRWTLNSLSIDTNTGALTRSAHDRLIEELVSNGLLERMRQAGYVMQLSFYDLDLLKMHNTLGHHAGGDAAIRMAVKKLQDLYRRHKSQDDTAGFLGHIDAAKEAVIKGIEFDTIARFDQGDEIVVASFLPPASGSRQQPKTSEDVGREVKRIKAAFNGLFVEYPLALSSFDQAYAIAHAGGMEITQTQSGFVRAPLTVTFATVLAEIPLTGEQFRSVVNMADATAMGAKALRRSVATRGIALSLIDESAPPDGAPGAD